MHLVNLVDCFCTNLRIFIAFVAIVVIKTLFVTIRHNWTIVIRQMLWTRNIHKVDIYKDSRKIWKQLFWMSKFLYCNTVCNPFQGIVFFFMELVQSRLSSKFSYNVAFFVFTKSHYQYRYDWFISENNIENVIGYSKYWKTFLGRY